MSVVKKRYISKSEFVQSFDCDRKLYYRKNRYPQSTDGDLFLQMLADGGHMIGEIAKWYYPGGIEIASPPYDHVEETASLLQNNAVTLFEAPIAFDDFIAVVDILHKAGPNSADLLEVKSASIDATDQETIAKDLKATSMKKYLIDITFQYFVATSLYPQWEITPYLFLVDKKSVNPDDGLINDFELIPADAGAHFKKPEVRYKGDSVKQQAVVQSNLLVKIDVSEYVQVLLLEVKARAAELQRVLLALPAAPDPVLKVRCKDCPFRVQKTDTLQSGFDECWAVHQHAPVPDARLAVDMAAVGHFNKTSKNAPIGAIDVNISNGKVYMTDVPQQSIMDKYNNRAFLQVSCGDERVRQGLESELDGLVYPLHFIDFETSAMAVPYHVGMHPYERVAFQWSCHTIEQPGGDFIHKEWINTVDRYPNFEFLRALKEHCGSTGTLLTWSPYEATTLKSIRNVVEIGSAGNQFLDLEVKNELLAWIDMVVTKDGRANPQDLIIYDMHDALKRYEYFHPLMKGRTSIKVTLPAVLAATRSPRVPAWLQDLNVLEYDASNIIVDPYKVLAHAGKQSGLSELDADDDENALTVSDGGGAMRVYQDLMYGLRRDDAAFHQSAKDALLRYCKLDTLAMVIIWEHWVHELITMSATSGSNINVVP